MSFICNGENGKAMNEGILLRHEKVIKTIAPVLTTSNCHFRLMPANMHHRDGKRHINTVPVRLLKARNSGRKEHADRAFARAVVQQTEEFACLFDEDSVCYISQDDKARVPLGLPAANKQTQILMHLEYKVILLLL